MVFGMAAWSSGVMLPSRKTCHNDFLPRSPVGRPLLAFRGPRNASRLFGAVAVGLRPVGVRHAAQRFVDSRLEPGRGVLLLSFDQTTVGNRRMCYLLGQTHTDLGNTPQVRVRC